jgi:hypothetical protein
VTYRDTRGEENSRDDEAKVAGKGTMAVPPAADNVVGVLGLVGTFTVTQTEAS